MESGPSRDQGPTCGPNISKSALAIFISFEIQLYHMSMYSEMQKHTAPYPPPFGGVTGPWVRRGCGGPYRATGGFSDLGKRDFRPLQKSLKLLL